MFNIPFQCKKSISITKPLAVTMSAVGDFQSWKHWSPWLCMEKDCHLVVGGNAQEPGHRQEWDGLRIGSGTMELTSKVDCSFYYDLVFLKPWKSKSTVEFHFEEKGDSTEVTWIMNGSLPIFMFFMKKAMKAWVESDFDRGLIMLKDYLEHNLVESNTDIIGVQNKDGFYYLGIRKETSIEEMPGVMSKDFELLMGWVSNAELPQPKETLSFYHKFDMVNKRCDFTSVLTYSEPPENSKNLVFGEVPEHHTLQVLHTGAYKHLGNAWSTVMAEQRTKKLKANKLIPWYELYLNSPGEVMDKELKTEVNIAIKA